MTWIKCIHRISNHVNSTDIKSQQSRITLIEAASLRVVTAQYSDCYKQTSDKPAKL
jgi:hypothetical protein